jgi:hypothetical protein
VNQIKLAVEAELEELQRESFEYFLCEVNTENGLIRDKTKADWPASIAATGVALASYPVGVERGFMTRDAATQRTLITLRFFSNSHQGIEPDATGYKGFYYHFLDMNTGKRVWGCELSTVDSVFLLAGMLTAGMYFNANTPDENEIRMLADALYRRADWRWAQNNGDTVTQGWTPETGFFPYRWDGYNEALLLYILGLGSHTYPLTDNCYPAWTSSYKWINSYGYDYLYSGPLFTHQLSQIWLDLRNVQDAYMREKNSTYFENSRRATYVQQQYAIHNPQNFVGYSACCWGITASDGPGPCTVKIDNIERTFYDYVARAVPDGPDDGTNAPWAAITSLPFAPDIVLPVIDHCIYDLKLKAGNKYGFKSTFNQTFRGDHACGWVSAWHFAINQGPIVLMTENYRTGFLWDLMRTCPYLVNGLKRAGFNVI